MILGSLVYVSEGTAGVQSFMISKDKESIGEKPFGRVLIQKPENPMIFTPFLKDK